MCFLGVIMCGVGRMRCGVCGDDVKMGGPCVGWNGGEDWGAVWGAGGRVCGAGAGARECVECVDMKILSNIII